MYDPLSEADVLVVVSVILCACGNVRVSQLVNRVVSKPNFVAYLWLVFRDSHATIGNKQLIKNEQVNH